jgi:NADPH:quinone reductase-like Zn-dependent oxidoreductase
MALEKVIRIDRVGGPEIVPLDDTDVFEPGLGEIRLRHMAVSLNSAASLILLPGDTLAPARPHAAA